MYELKTNTAVRIAVGPLVDPSDYKTAETGLTVTGMSVEIFQIKTDGNAVVRAQFSPTASGGNNDMVHVTDDTTGMYDLELTAAQLNFLGNGRIAFYDVDGFIVHWIDIHVVSAAYFDWKYGSTVPQMALADDAITASKFDESTAFPLKSADTGATAVARTGADSDTLETLSDQIDTVSGYIDTEVAAIKAKTDLIPASPAAIGSAMTLTAAYDAAKTAAAAGAQMDLVNAPNATAVTAIQSGLATGSAVSTVDTVVDAIKIVTDALVTALELDGTVYRFTENALEEAPTGGGTPITVNDIFTGTIEGSINLQEALMLMLAFVAGEATGGGTTTVNFRNQADTKNRISYTVDEDGNRTAVTLDLT